METIAERHLLYGILVVAVAALGFSVWSLGSEFFQNPATQPTTTSTAPTSSTQSLTQSFLEPITTGSTDQGDVAIELTPSKIDNGLLEVALAANTHSVDLSQFDLQKTITLEYDGQKIAPTSVPVLQGHHASGRLNFNLGTNTKTFTIRIIGIPQVQERLFIWK